MKFWLSLEPARIQHQDHIHVTILVSEHSPPPPSLLPLPDKPRHQHPPPQRVGRAERWPTGRRTLRYTWAKHENKQVGKRKENILKKTTTEKKKKKYATRKNTNCHTLDPHEGPPFHFFRQIQKHTQRKTTHQEHKIAIRARPA